jgi:cobalt-precorrin-5B (C1)-methyltransferase
LDIACKAGLPLGDWVAAKARAVAIAEADGKVDIELLIFDRAGETVGHAGFDAR